MLFVPGLEGLVIAGACVWRVEREAAAEFSGVCVAGTGLDDPTVQLSLTR